MMVLSLPLAYLPEVLTPLTSKGQPSAAGTPRLAIPAVDSVVPGKEDQRLLPFFLSTLPTVTSGIEGRRKWVGLLLRHHRSLNGRDIVTRLKKNHEK